jgi:hypothetical protein
MRTRDYHVGDILSVTTGHLVSPRGMDGVYDILRWMAGESVFTHQIPRVCREAEPVLLALHPQLASADKNAVNSKNYDAWLAAQVARFGETLPVPQMTNAEHERIDPMSEAAEKIHPDRIIIAVGR